MRFHVILISVAMIGGAGCGTAPGRKLAEDLSSSTAAYEKQINAKIAAENKFYAEQLFIVRKQMTGEVKFEHFKTQSDADKQKLIREILLYGRIRLGSQRQARLAAASILDDGTSPTTALIGLLDTGISEDLHYARDLRARQLALRMDHVTGLAKLDYAKDDLATVRKQLAAIAASPSTSDELKAWLIFGQSLRDELNKERK